jgi:hypothetical protein
VAKAKAPAKFDLKAKVGPGTFKQPVWVWVIVGVGGYYIYKRATGAVGGGAAADSTTTDAGYYDPGYAPYAGSNGTGAGAGGFTDSPPADPYVGPVPDPLPVPVEPGPGGGGHKPPKTKPPLKHPKHRPCPSGYHSVGSSCVKNRGRRAPRAAVTG